MRTILLCPIFYRWKKWGNLSKATVLTQAPRPFHCSTYHCYMCWLYDAHSVFDTDPFEGWVPLLCSVDWTSGLLSIGQNKIEETRSQRNHDFLLESFISWSTCLREASCLVTIVPWRSLHGEEWSLWQNPWASAILACPSVQWGLQDRPEPRPADWPQPRGKTHFLTKLLLAFWPMGGWW